MGTQRKALTKRQRQVHDDLMMGDGILRYDNLCWTPCYTYTVLTGDRPSNFGSRTVTVSMKTVDEMFAAGYLERYGEKHLQCCDPARDEESE